MSASVAETIETRHRSVIISILTGQIELRPCINLTGLAIRVLLEIGMEIVIRSEISFLSSARCDMTREEARAVIAQLGAACFDRTLDVALFLVCSTALAAVHPRTTRGIHASGREAEAIVAACGGEQVRSWFRRLRAKGWIGQDLRPTTEGQRRIAGRLPRVRWSDRWNQRWHLVSFDVVERDRAFRDRLRRTLQRLGFGKLHASLWVSPWNAFGDLERALAIPKGSRSVIFGISDQLGTEESRSLAATIWPLHEMNEQYRLLREQVSGIGSTSDTFGFSSHALAVLAVDPQLPRELLPAPWHGFALVRLLAQRMGPIAALGSGWPVKTRHGRRLF